jgi:hypothetical protein
MNIKDIFCIYLYKEPNLPTEERMTEETNYLFDIALIYNITHAPFHTFNIIQTHSRHHLNNLNNLQSCTHTGTTHNQEDNQVWNSILIYI